MVKITPKALFAGDAIPKPVERAHYMQFANMIAPVPLRILEEKIIDNPHNATERLARLAEITLRTGMPDISVVAKALLRRDLPKVNPSLYNATIRALY